ncbi:MAG: GC-type dockerin domain-anchored protein [Planctomycetota bacterium]
MQNMTVVRVCAAAALTAALPTRAQVLNLPPDTVPSFSVIPSGTTVNVFAGGVIPLGVDLADGELNIDGGSVAVGASGISTGFTNTNNTVNVRGGTVGGFFQLFSGTQLSLEGGQMESFGVFSGSTANITGGTVTRFPDTFSTGTVNLSGGDVLSIRAFTGSTINITGTSFEFDGSPIAGLSESPTTFTQRGEELRVILLDGSEFTWTLRTSDPGFFAADPGFATTGATINLILISEPCVPDVNGDGSLTPADFNAWVLAFNSGSPECDQNGDGVCTPADFNAWVLNFNAGCG